MRRLSIIALCAVLASCGEFFDFETQALLDGGEMHLGRKVVTISVGDRYAIPVTFTPKELSNTGVFWLLDNDSVARFDNDTLVALAEGHTQAIAFSSIDRLRDTCTVVVIPRFYVAPDTYPYDMVIYASVNIHGMPLTLNNSAQYAIGAYVGDELRGLGQIERRADTDYLVLRVWSPYPQGEQVQLRCYFRGEARCELFADEFTFDGERHGSLNSLYPLILGEDAQEYLPDIDFGDDNPIIEDPDTIQGWIIDGQQ